MWSIYVWSMQNKNLNLKKTNKKRSWNRKNFYGIYLTQILTMSLTVMSWAFFWTQKIQNQLEDSSALKL